MLDGAEGSAGVERRSDILHFDVGVDVTDVYLCSTPRYERRVPAHTDSQRCVVCLDLCPVTTASRVRTTTIFCPETGKPIVRTVRPCEWCAQPMFYDAGTNNPTCPECVWTHGRSLGRCRAPSGAGSDS